MVQKVEQGLSAPQWSFQFRYIAYVIILVINYQETFTRFGLPMTMVAGMVKRNCSDPLDNGTYCWSEDIKASAIGAFFYTFTLQAPVTWIASKIGFIIMLRVYVLISGLVMVGMPWFASVSPYCVIIAQAVRGVVTCVFISNNFNFVRSWTIPAESAIYLATTGSVQMLGVFTGQMLAGLISSAYSWEYFYYICGAVWFLLLALHVAFVQADVQKSRWLSPKEKALYAKTECNASIEAEPGKGKLPLSQIFRKVYLYAFCVFLFTYNCSFYMVCTVFPFYLSEILHFTVDQCSMILLGVGVAMAANMVAVSNIYPVVDRYIPWLRSRQLFTFGPLVLQVALLFVLPNVPYRPLAVLVIVVLALTTGTLYAGSVATLNYELDPVNAAVVVSIYNSCGQLSGFFGPWFREQMTTTDQFDPNYEEVYAHRWAEFFYASSVAPVVGILVVYGAMKLKPAEWRFSPLLISEKNSVVVENRGVEGGGEKSRVECAEDIVMENDGAI